MWHARPVARWKWEGGAMIGALDGWTDPLCHAMASAMPHRCVGG